MTRMFGILVAAVFLCGLVISQPSRAMIIWGYDGGVPAQTKYRHLIVDYTAASCGVIRKNNDPGFILAPYINYLTGIGSRVTMRAPGCIHNLDHASVTLVTPRHIIVSENLGAWNQAQTVAFVGTDNQTYIVNTRPGYRKLINSANPALNTDIALVELEAPMPATVMPVFVANYSMQNMGQIKNGMTYYAFGNAHIGPNYNSWQGYGDPNAKAVGMNKIVLSQGGAYSGFGITTDGPVEDYLKAPENPASKNWNDYWHTEQALPPQPGVAFTRAYDTSSPMIVLISDINGIVRPHVFGLNWTFNTGSSLGFVYNDLLVKIAEYNQKNGTSYAINSASGLAAR